MSDVDRLRAAADRLDEWAVEYHRRGGGPLTLVDAWEKQSALLRVALLHVDEHVCPYPYAPHGNNTWVGIAQTDFGGDLDPCPVLVAALALADTLLGDGPGR